MSEQAVAPVEQRRHWNVIVGEPDQVPGLLSASALPTAAEPDTTGSVEAAGFAATTTPLSALAAEPPEAFEAVTVALTREPRSADVST